MTQDQINKLFRAFESKSILVIGDILIDSYMFGKVDRISPEAPIPIVDISNKENRLGGAANVALNLKALGANVMIASVIGDDDRASLILDLLKKEHLETGNILRSAYRETSMKTRIISSGQQLIRVDEEMTHPLIEDDETQFIKDCKILIKRSKPDAIVFQDYDKGVITPVLIDEIILEAHQAEVPVLVDPKKRNFLRFAHVDLFKPNLKELNQGLLRNISKDDVNGLIHAAKKLHETLKVKQILITLSEAGIFTSDGTHFHTLPAHIRNISDVSGAGDTVISVAALGMACNLSLIDIATIANLAGGIVCEIPGVVPIDKKQLLEECLMAYK